ncbi:MAG: hypothetical protein ACREQP_14110 [Candidatus Binatia bacterium]
MRKSFASLLQPAAVVGLLWSLPAAADAQESKARIFNAADSGSPATADASLSAAILGCWVGKEGPVNGITIHGVTCYERGGKTEMKAELSGDGIRLPINIKGTWRITERKLIMIVTETSTPQILPKGHTSTDAIVSISTDRMVLIAEDGTKLTHERFKVEQRPNHPPEPPSDKL